MDRNKRTYSRESIGNNGIPNSDSHGRQELDEITISKVVLSNSPQFSKKLKSDYDKSNNNNINRERRPQTSNSQSSTTKLPELDRQYRSLEPGQMLNDTVVEFYLNYIFNNRLNSTLREKLHIFSTFFYAKIKTLQKSNGNDLDKSIMRWNKEVKIFEKDYIVIPVCDCKHWVLVIICFAHKQPPAQDETIVIDSPQTNATHASRLIIFDSLGHKYMPRFTDPIRNFLNLRWQYERPNDERRDFKDRKSFMDLYAKVPKQRNSFDCGVYLLHYLEQFLKNPQLTYTQIKNGRDFTMEWTMDPRMKRMTIKSLIPRQAQPTSSGRKNFTID